MNILVIGNGFDLAHGLPTKYTDFLEWIKAEYGLYYDLIEQKAEIINKIGEVRIDWAIRACPSKYRIVRGNDEKVQLELWKCINNNIWIDYFLRNTMYEKENWIDFETEISEVIQSFDKDIKGKNFYGQIEGLTNEFLEKRFLYDGFEYLLHKDKSEKKKITYVQLRDILINDLNRLIRAFEIYLTEYVEKIDCNIISPDIERVLPKEIAKYNGVPVYDTYILSFNYTNTFQRLYIDKEHNKYFEKYVDYIHGKADSNNTVETNNMVLGIDEYLGKKKRNKQVEFIAFKKFYQRIHKGTGCKHKEWIDIIKEESADYRSKLEKSKTEKNSINLEIAVDKLNKQYLNKHHVYIFGHSLDVTDKDILRDLILNDNVHTTIFYHTKEAMGQQIANLVKVIGQDELIRRTGGKDKLIEFKPQKQMIPINN